MSPYDAGFYYPVMGAYPNTRRTAADILGEKKEGTDTSVFSTQNRRTAADILEERDGETPAVSGSVENKNRKTVADVLRENGRLKTDETIAAVALDETKDLANTKIKEENIEFTVHVISSKNDNQPLISTINAGETVEFDGNTRKIKLPDGSSPKYSFTGNKVLYEDADAGIKIETNPGSENGKLRHEKITFGSGDNTDVLKIEEQSTGLKATLNGETKKLAELFPKDTEVTLPNSGVKITRNFYDIKAQGENYNLDFSVMDFDKNDLQKWYFNTKLTYNTVNNDNLDNI